MCRMNSTVWPTTSGWKYPPIDQRKGTNSKFCARNGSLRICATTEEMGAPIFHCEMGVSCHCRAVSSVSESQYEDVAKKDAVFLIDDVGGGPRPVRSQITTFISKPDPLHRCFKYPRPVTEKKAPEGIANARTPAMRRSVHSFASLVIVKSSEKSTRFNSAARVKPM